MIRRVRRAGDVRRVRSVRVLLIGTVVVGILTGCTSHSGAAAPSPVKPSGTGTPSAGVRDPATQASLARFYRQKVTWKDCGDDYQCTKVTVPVDWTAPGGATIQLALAKLPASGKKIGSLLINPGGPGVSGIDYARAARSAIGQSVRDAYDIVGWDPRGVGESAPVKCISNGQLDAFFAADGTPDNAAELATAVTEQKQFAQACETNTGALFAHVDTLNTVKDMDVLRAVLGDSTLSYLGASYGTFLGAWYAQEFPWRVGRLVLDGAVDPSLTSAQYAAGQAMGFERGLRGFVENCLSQRSCPLRGTVEQAYAQLGSMVAHADQNPLRTSSGRQLTQSLMTTGLAMGMYTDQFWPAVLKGIQEAQQGDGATLLKLADAYLERDSKGVYKQTFSATNAIYCLDHAETRTPEQIGADAAALAKKYPPLGDTIGWGSLGCAEWPVPAVLKPQRLTAVGAAPILVVATTGDPATPYEWGKALASQLSSGRLLTWQGQGHTAYERGSTCVDRIVEAYLVAGKVPAANTTCQ